MSTAPAGQGNKGLLLDSFEPEISADSLSLSADGKVLAIKTIDAQDKAIPALTFTQDGSRFYTYGWDGKVKVWDVAKLLE